MQQCRPTYLVQPFSTVPFPMSSEVLRRHCRRSSVVGRKMTGFENGFGRKLTRCSSNWQARHPHSCGWQARDPIIAHASGVALGE